MRADTKIIFEMFDTDSKVASALECNDCQTDITTLKNERADTSLYATTEPNGFLLDGNYKIPAEKPAGLYSGRMTGANGSFATPVVLDVSFSSPVTSSGITLHFPQGEYPTSMDIAWVKDGTTVHEGRFYPNRPAFFCQANVQEFDGLAIKFYGTQIPNHFLKLRGIDYGQSLLFSADKIIKSNVVQDISILCDEISVNTLEFEVEDKDKLFSVVSANSVFFAVQESQKITVYSTISGEEKKMGVYYLKSLTGSGVRARFTAQDVIGLLDSTDEVGEKYYDTAFGLFCEEILAGFKYDIDPELKVKRLTGYLTGCSRREALQQACFAVGGVADTWGDDVIKIFALPKMPSHLIMSHSMYSGGKVESITPYKYLSITAHDYDKDGIDNPTVIVKELNPKAKNRAEVNNAVFVNRDNVDSVIERLTDYYNRKVLYSFKMPIDTLYKMGDMIMSYMDNSYIKGNITSMDINPSGGLIADITIKGYVFSTSDDGIYTGEIYAGERGVV